MAGYPPLVGHDDALTISRSCQELTGSWSAKSGSGSLSESAAAQGLGRRSLQGRRARLITKEGSAQPETTSCLVPNTAPNGVTRRRRAYDSPSPESAEGPRRRRRRGGDA